MSDLYQKKLGFGLMRLPLQSNGSIDRVLLCQMIDRFLEAGFTYFDTAYVYHDGYSERAVRDALVERHPREAFTLATKMPHNFLNCKEDVDATFQEQLARTGAGYFDFYLMHGVNDRNWERYERFGCWEHAMRMKREGLIHHMGFSFHGTPKLLERTLREHPEVEFVQLQINYADWDSPRICAHACYDIVRGHHLPILVMEPVKGGMLADLPAGAADILRTASPQASQASWALRYVAGLPGISVVLSGMNSLDQLEDNIATFNALQPLDESEQTALSKAASTLLNVPTEPCTGCRYCVAGCPAGLEIPALISVLNNCRLFRDSPSIREFWNRGTQGGILPGRCLACGQCEAACPQHLSITSLFKELSNPF